jgi:hypothetical protein
MSLRNYDKMARYYRFWDVDRTILKDVLNALAGKRRRGDPLPLAQIEAMRKGRERKKRKRRVAAIKRAAERDKPRRRKYHRNFGWSIADRIVRTMEPGCWYGAGDLAQAVGAPAKQGRSRIRQRLLRASLVERTANPEWTATHPNPWEVMAGAAVEPRWLYRLTGAGEAYRVGLLSKSSAPSIRDNSAAAQKLDEGNAVK